MPIYKEIIYPIFLECCQYTPDAFWENIFEDLAYGKTPYGTYINKEYLCCNYKNKEFSYKIEKTKSSRVLYDEIYDLLANKLGILSQREKKKKIIDFHIVEENIKESRKDWANIRKKNVKDILIEDYVIDKKEQHNLSIKQAKYLLSIIFIGIVFKVISSKDIDYSDGKIHNIRGIDFDNKKIIMRKNVYNLEVSFAPSIIIDKQTMSDNWNKYLENLRKISNNVAV